MSQAASRGFPWALAGCWLVVFMAAPGIVSALTGGRTRTVALLVCVGVELLTIACFGLYLRARGRA
ncbi:hypothetical protein [Streptomyces sp. NPDC060198]|uniref:hypothetical protein n=1 Tax=Streptomyces sp. NPDC060198 TaxID=3347070 RepID=UPI00364C4117